MIRLTSGPTSLTVLATYQCTAACKECCFECSPKLTQRLSLPEIHQAIDQASAFASLRLVVFSGGECFLLGKELVSAVGYAHNRGLLVRCVTNGYWSTSSHAALLRLRPLQQAGLTELNLSTGDDHQAFVPFGRVVTAAITAAELGIRTLIVVEGNDSAKFQLQDALADSLLQEFMRDHPNGALLSVMSNIWMPFFMDSEITHKEHLTRDPEIRSDLTGCDNILGNIVVTPTGMVASCCGLTMEHIPAMKLGSLRDESIVSLYQQQLSDFLKIWIHTDGPERIILWARQYDSAINIPPTVHPCEACAVLHQDERILSILRNHYHEVVDAVMHRYFATQAVAQLVADL